MIMIEHLMIRIIATKIAENFILLICYFVTYLPILVVIKKYVRINIRFMKNNFNKKTNV